MAFALNGTIAGGNFIHVRGDMYRVSNSYNSRLSGQSPENCVRDFPPRGMTGALRTHQARHQSTHPYATATPHYPYGGQTPALSQAAGPNTSSSHPANFLPHTGEFYNYIDLGQTSPRLSENASHTFNSVEGDMNQINVTSYGVSGMDILYRKVVQEALHDSGERFPEPACHPGTRSIVLEQLRSWAVDTSPESTLLWLHGPAGIGKSAIAQMFAGDCQNQGRHGASFFFKRGHPSRGTWHGLIATIAYQLAHSVPEFAFTLQQAVENEKLVLGRSLVVQFDKLLVQPFSHIPVVQNRPVVILDGLDECEDRQTHQQLLRLLIRAVRARQLPVRLLISSRPEPHIREVIRTEDTIMICREFELSADRSAYNDIRTYLQDEFARFRFEYMTRGIDLKPVWPSAQDLEHLVQKSSGIFIYATTVVRFVGDEYSHPGRVTHLPHPIDRLNTILALDPQSTAPLDDLYTQILSSLPQNEQALRMLYAIWHNYSIANLNSIADGPEEIDTLLALRPGTCRLMLRGLHSIFRVSSIRTRLSLRGDIEPLHASLMDYLCDVRRSGQWCISLSWLQLDYFHCMVRLLSSPPVTQSDCAVHLSALEQLRGLLGGVVPSDTLIQLLRNVTFQASIFLEVSSDRPWPQRGAPYPPDLILLWEHHVFISDLISHIGPTPSEGIPTLKFDRIYRHILSRDPDLLFVLRYRTLASDVDRLFRLARPSLTYQMFCPFLEFQELFLDFPFHEGDSPTDFLEDPDRAGDLYRDPQDIAEDLVLLWIRCAKNALIWSDDCILEPNFLQWLPECGPSGRILSELGSLDLTQFCEEMAADPEGHREAHTNGLHPDYLSFVLDWLGRFPDPPVQVIELWERQKADIERCVEDLGD